LGRQAPYLSTERDTSALQGSTDQMSLLRYGKIYCALWKNSVVREMGFKTNFLLWIVVELLWFALQLCFIGVLYSHTDRIGTWSKWEVVTLMAASHFIQQIFTALFLSN
jgi:ABC-2 type transport system permease protein